MLMDKASVQICQYMTTVSVEMQAFDLAYIRHISDKNYHPTGPNLTILWASILCHT
jgi:hypothetical protein